MNALIFTILVSCSFAFLLTRLVIPIFVWVAHRYDILDRPDGIIKNHGRAIPYLGGVAVYISTLIVSFIYSVPTHAMIWLFLGCTTLLIIGLVDDLVVISPLQKFVGQIIAVIFFLYGGMVSHVPITPLWLTIPFTSFYMLTVINAFNLIDVMDGLASAIALTSCVGFFLLALITGSYSIVFIMAAFIGSLMAFLHYNWPPARMYLGDAGSLFIGGFLASLPFCIDLGLYNPIGHLMPIVVLAIPLLEVVALIVIRGYKKIPFYQGSLDHFYMYLRSQGWSKQAVLYFVSAISPVLTTCALCATVGFLNIVHTTIFLATFLCFWFFIVYCRAYRAIFQRS